MTGKGADLKNGAITRILFFYTTLLGTAIVMPLFLATSGDAAVAIRAANMKTDASLQAQTDAAVKDEFQVKDEYQVWERSAPARAAEEGPLDIRTMVEMHRALRFPQMDIPRAGQSTTDKPVPDAAILRPGKPRAKVIKA